VFDNLLEAADMMAAHPLHDDVVLYTDADVIFEPNVEYVKSLQNGDLAVPDVFSVSTDLNVGDYDDFNSGVIVFRISGYLRIYDEIWGFMNRTAYACVADAWDQGCLQAFAASKGYMNNPSFRLPPQWAWRPYLTWPRDTVPPGQVVRLIHFHGLKPAALMKNMFTPLVESGVTEEITLPPIYVTFWKMNPKGYADALSKWFAYARILV
jgi:hypothetical protein